MPESLSDFSPHPSLNLPAIDGFATKSVRESFGGPFFQKKNLRKLYIGNYMEDWGWTAIPSESHMLQPFSLEIQCFFSFFLYLSNHLPTGNLLVVACLFTPETKKNSAETIVSYASLPKKSLTIRLSSMASSFTPMNQGIPSIPSSQQLIPWRNSKSIKPSQPKAPRGGEENSTMWTRGLNNPYLDF